MLTPGVFFDMLEVIRPREGGENGGTNDRD